MHPSCEAMSRRCGQHVQMDIEFGDNDMVWIDPGTDYGSTWELCRTLTDGDGAPVFIEPGEATVDNFYILFDAGERVRRISNMYPTHCTGHKRRVLNCKVCAVDSRPHLHTDWFRTSRVQRQDHSPRWHRGRRRHDPRQIPRTVDGGWG